MKRKYKPSNVVIFNAGLDFTLLYFLTGQKHCKKITERMVMQSSHFFLDIIYNGNIVIFVGSGWNPSTELEKGLCICFPVPFSSLYCSLSWPALSLSAVLPKKACTFVALFYSGPKLL